MCYEQWFFTWVCTVFLSAVNPIWQIAFVQYWWHVLFGPQCFHSACVVVESYSRYFVYRLLSVILSCVVFFFNLSFLIFPVLNPWPFCLQRRRLIHSHLSVTQALLSFSHNVGYFLCCVITFGCNRSEFVVSLLDLSRWRNDPNWQMSSRGKTILAFLSIFSWTFLGRTCLNFLEGCFQERKASVVYSVFQEDKW